MADADFDSLDGGYRSTPRAASQSYMTLAGGLASLALLVGALIWGYQLAVRDVRGVPVIQAMEGPMRIAAADPGGEIADHQGLAVNDVAAEGVAAPPPERLVLAPRPVELAPEDIAGLAGAAPPGPEFASAPGLGAPAPPDLALAAAPPTESASPTAIAVDAALAEALGELPPDPALADTLLETGEPLPDVIRDPAPEGAIIASPRPKARPAARPVASETAQLVAAPVEVDPATIPAGTRLVQFGAFETAEEARAEWQRLAVNFGALMDGKGLVLQPAESGGRTFFRLRAHGFEDEADARRFCSAFVAQNGTCIPVPQR